MHVLVVRCDLPMNEFNTNETGRTMIRIAALAVAVLPAARASELQASGNLLDVRNVSDLVDFLAYLGLHHARGVHYKYKYLYACMCKVSCK